jgi:ankyrin repeat protein
MTTAALVGAAGRGDVGEVRRLLDEGGADIEGWNGRGWTALIVAARWGHRDVVEYLLDRGANIEARGRYGDTPLFAAAREGHREVVECLLEGYPGCWTGVTKEVKHLVSVICLMITSTTSTTPHHRECSTLLAVGHLLDSKQNDAMGASSQDLLALVMNEVDQYLRRGQRADINARTNAGDTAVALAARHGHSNVVECLRARGAVA